jgi:hypothetical protein
MAPIDQLPERIDQLDEIEKASGIEVLNFAYAREQASAAKAAVTAGASRLQDSFAKVWAILLPIKREQMPNGQLWADLIAIKNRMVFYNPAGLKPNKMKASLALMRDDHAGVLKEMICRLDADVRATA